MATGRGARGWWLALALMAVVGVAMWCGREWWIAWRYRQAIEVIKEQIEGGHHTLAVRDLRFLLAHGGDTARTLYLLGFCERARGNPDAAAEVCGTGPVVLPVRDRGRAGPDGDGRRARPARRCRTDHPPRPRRPADRRIRAGAGVRACLRQGRPGRGRPGADRGGLDAPERSRPGRYGTGDPPGPDARRGRVAGRPGRSGSLPPRSSRTPDAGRRSRLAGKSQPGDPHRLVRRGGAVARRLLARQPDDVSVWRARLAWAMASNRVEEALEAQGHLPAADGERPARAETRGVAGRAARGPRGRAARWNRSSSTFPPTSPLMTG